MSKIVYIVWGSDYTEDGIHAIFSTKQKAEEFVEYSSNEYDYIDEAIEAIEIDKMLPDRSMKVYKVRRDADSDEYKIVEINPYGESHNLVTYKHTLRLFNVKAHCRSEAIAAAKEREQYIKEHREEYPLLGKLCRFRRKLDRYPHLEQEVVMPTYNFVTKEMVTFNDWCFFREEPV